MNEESHAAAAATAGPGPNPATVGTRSHRPATSPPLPLPQPGLLDADADADADASSDPQSDSHRLSAPATEAEAASATTTATDGPAATREDFRPGVFGIRALAVHELRTMLRDMGLDTRGHKVDLQHRLRRARRRAANEISTASGAAVNGQHRDGPAVATEAGGNIADGITIGTSETDDGDAVDDNDDDDNEVAAGHTGAEIVGGGDGGEPVWPWFCALEAQPCVDEGGNALTQIVLAAVVVDTVTGSVISESVHTCNELGPPPPELLRWIDEIAALVPAPPLASTNSSSDSSSSAALQSPPAMRRPIQCLATNAPTLNLLARAMPGSERSKDASRIPAFDPVLYAIDIRRAASLWLGRWLAGLDQVAKALGVDLADSTATTAPMADGDGSIHNAADIAATDARALARARLASRCILAAATSASTLTSSLTSSPTPSDRAAKLVAACQRAASARPVHLPPQPTAAGATSSVADRCAPKSLAAASHAYYCVFDVEATCDDQVRDFRHEIIEFPVVLLSRKTGTVVAEFREFVRPTINPVLTDFCKKLTGITQEQVDAADPFPVVLARFNAWLRSRLHPTRPSPSSVRFATHGPWDIDKFVRAQCAASGVQFPPPAMARYIDVRFRYRRMTGQRHAGITDMLYHLGLGEFRGSEHSGIDDARNLARVVACLVDNS
ncbi:3'-5' exoribonuclease 1, partial [Cladochytrium tenue]